MESTTAPKIFISYSRKPEAIRQKVISLAERLQADGVHVIIDVWDLAEGHDKNVFMEQMVTNPDIVKVLIMCTEAYTEKANKRQGGVGTESTIISEEVYANAKQEKFIPIIFEKNDHNETFVPVFVKSRIYIDLYDETEYENNYEQLLRNIFDKPLHKRPPLGIPPGFIVSEDPNVVRTRRKTDQIINAILQEKKSAKFLINDYFELFIACLKEDYIILPEIISNGVYDDAVINVIGKTIDLRDDYLLFLNTLIRYEHLDAERLFAFFEKLIQKFVYHQDEMRHEHVLNEHRRFLVYEMFLYTVALLIQQEQFEAVHHLLYNPFFVQDENRQSDKFLYFTAMAYYSELLNKVRNQRLQLNRVCVVADLIKQRANRTDVTFEYLKGVDTLLFFVYLLHYEGRPRLYSRWFPYTNVYYAKPLLFMQRASSKRYLYKLLAVFDVQSHDDLIKIIDEKQLRGRMVNLINYDIPNIEEALQLDRLGTVS